jgi:uncharacterized protein
MAAAVMTGHQATGLAIGGGVILPLDAVTQPIALLAARRAGKSNAAAVLGEEMYDAGLPWVAIDPKGDWWGLRSNAAGTGPGLPIPIFGGLHGDLPLLPESGALMAELIVAHNLTCVLDVSRFSKTARARFLADFAERLYELHQAEPQPRFVFLEEAQAYCMTPDTEILTEAGWATWENVHVGTIVVAFDPVHGRYAYEPVQRVIQRQHHGEMVHLKTKALDCLVTPDHRVVLQRFQHDPARYRWYNWTFSPAGEVPGNVRLPVGGAPPGPGIPELDHEILRILGWIITDGYFHHRLKSDVIGLEQSMATKKRGVPLAEEMTQVLARQPGTKRSIRQPRPATSRGPAHAASFCWYLGAALSATLCKWLGDDIHRIPRRLLEECDVAQLQALYQGLMEGDGTSGGTDHWRAFYPGHNEGLADDFQELATRLGISTCKQQVPSNRQWHVTISARTSHTLRRRPTRTQYRGMVWDITVPSGAFVARRNGRVFVTGNCPQRVTSDMARCVGAFIQLVTMGGAFGLGAAVISQRSALVHKDVLTQVELMIAMRTTSPQDRRVVREWMEHHAIAGEIVESLPSLVSGEAWLSSSYWLPGNGLPQIQRMQFRRRRTFDSGATPQIGQIRRLTTLAEIDLAAVAEQMAAITEKAEAQDPKALLRRIADLEKQLAGRGDTGEVVRLRRLAADLEIRVTAAEAELAAERAREREPLFTRGQVDDLYKLLTTIADLGEQARHVAPIADILDKRPPMSWGAPARVTVKTAAAPATPAPASAQQQPPPVDEEDLMLGKAHRAILAVLAQFPEGRTVQQIAMLTGYSAKGGGFRNALGALRTAGMINRGDPVQATDAGIAAVDGAWEPLPEGPALVEHWMRQLGKAAQEALRVLLDAYPAALTREEIAAGTASQYSPEGGGFRNALGRLRTLQLIDGRGEMRADETLARHSQQGTPDA